MTPQEEQQLLSFLEQLGGVSCSGEVITDVDAQEFEAAHPLHLKLKDQQRLMGSPLLFHVHDHFLGLVCVEGEIVLFTPCHLLSIC